MNVKELKEIIADLPDTTKVYVADSDFTDPTEEYDWVTSVVVYDNDLIFSANENAKDIKRLYPK